MLRGPSILAVTFQVALVSLPWALAQQGTWQEAQRKGIAARDQGRIREAKQYLEEALLSPGLPPDDIRRADLEDSLAGVYHVLGDLAEADRLYRDAVAILNARPEQALSDSASQLRVFILGDLGALRLTQGRLPEAEALLQQAYEIRRKDLGPGHTTTLAAAAHLGQVFLMEGKLVRARELLEPAYAAFTDSKDVNQVDRAAISITTGMVFLRTRRYADAERALLQARSIAGGLGNSHPYLAESLMHLAELYRLADRPARSETLLREALGIYRTVLGEDSSAIGECLYQLAETEVAQHRYPDAERDYREAIDIFEKSQGATSPGLATALRRCAKLLRTNRTAEAKALEARAKQSSAVKALR